MREFDDREPGATQYGDGADHKEGPSQRPAEASTTSRHSVGKPDGFNGEADLVQGVLQLTQRFFLGTD